MARKLVVQVRVLVFHGYLLRGTGSNVFNASLAGALTRLGHEVHLLSQDRHPRELEFVGAVGEWESGALQLEHVRDTPCTVYRPDIGELLPVYVYDDYEGVTARLFPELTDDELATYIDANVHAVSDVIARARPDLALANHLIMGPLIVARALAGTGVPYAVQIHGSALEYTVRPHPRFLPYAREGIGAAAGVLVGSRHSAESLWSVLDQIELRARTGFGSPGVDTDRFRPLPARDAVAQGRLLAAALRSAPQTQSARSTFSRDRASGGRAVAKLAEQREQRLPLVAFVGKLILAKGIDLLLAAWPLVLAEVPQARLAVVGFGAYEEAARRLARALGERDLETVWALAHAGRREEGGQTRSLRFLSAFLDGLEGADKHDAYLGAASYLPETVTFTGRLEHDELADLLPLFDALVVPSTFPEAFGMVAVEAAASGVLPISAGHSGLAEVSGRLAASLPEPAAELVSFPLDERAIESLAQRVVRWLRADSALRDQVRARLPETIAAHYSWEQTARRVIDAARGKLEPLD
jgi:glycosyltransferase involved in cell wall biosynthesis